MSTTTAEVDIESASDEESTVGEPKVDDVDGMGSEEAGADEGPEPTESWTRRIALASPRY